jgi:hypothetical protein
MSAGGVALPPTGLRSTPDCRPRRTYLHLSYSYAPPCGPALLVTQDPLRKRTADRKAPGLNLLHCRRLPCAIEKRRRIVLRPVEPHHQYKGSIRCRQPVRLLVRSRIARLDQNSTVPSASALSLLRPLSVYRFSGFGTKKYCASYIVSDQKPRTGGIWPLGKRITYLSEPFNFCPVLSTVAIG